MQWRGQFEGVVLWLPKLPLCVHRLVDASSAGSSLTSAVSSEATVAEAFLRMFVETCGHYDYNITTTQRSGEKIFQVLTAQM